MYLLIGRAAATTAKHHFLKSEGISGAKNRPHIMLTAYIVKYHHKRYFLRLPKFSGRQPIHLLDCEFVHILLLAYRIPIVSRHHQFVSPYAVACLQGCLRLGSVHIAHALLQARLLLSEFRLCGVHP